MQTVTKKVGLAILASDKMRYITKEEVGNLINTEGQPLSKHNIPKCECN